MENIKLNERLLTAVQFVREGSRLVDIGTDHGYLPIFLILEGRIPFAIAADINRGPLDKADEKTARTSYVPSLETKYYDIVTGNCDAVIHFTKIGDEYLRQVTQKRAAYKKESIKDDRVRKLLASCNGMFTD